MSDNDIIRKKIFVKDCKTNAVMDDLFVLAEKGPITKYRNKPGHWFILKIQDSSGEMEAKFWGDEDLEKLTKVYEALQVNGVVRIRGNVEVSAKYGTSININTEGGIEMVPLGSYALEDFVRKSEKDTEELLKELRGAITSISDPEIKQIMDAFFEDPEFVKKFVNCPGAMKKHHGWVGGLLEHTVSVVKICLTISDFHKDLKRDLLIAGAILHDIGKIRELETTTRIYYTDDGNLIGHIVLGIQMLTRKLDELSISEPTKQKLLHLIASHHGSGDFGSPVTPCFPEAIVVHKADELDAKTVQMFEEIKNAQTDEKFSWSKDFDRIMVRDE